jgi:hypothetical protein
MKNLIFLTISLFLTLSKLPGQDGTLKPYSVKSGILEYKYSGDKTGKGTLYFDDYGTKTALFMDAVKDGEFNRGWVVTFGDSQYMWDPDNPGEGMKLKNPLAGWIASSSKGDIESFTESMYAKMGMEKSGNESFMGKDCKVLKGKMGKVLTWNGILMLLDLKMTGYSSHEEVTSMKTNIPVDAKYFIIPVNIKFSEMPGL